MKYSAAKIDTRALTVLSIWLVPFCFEQPHLYHSPFFYLENTKTPKPHPSSF